MSGRGGAQRASVRDCCCWRPASFASRATSTASHASQSRGATTSVKADRLLRGARFTVRVKGDDGDGLREPTASEAPWMVGTYYTRRKVRETKLGQISGMEDRGDVSDPIGWDEDAKIRLAVTCVAKELGLSEKFVQKKTTLLQKLVPDLKPKLSTMKVADLARLATMVHDVPSQLLALRDIFPTANISRLVSQRPTILLEDMESVKEKANELRNLLGASDVDRTVERNPTFLEVDQVRIALAEVTRLMPRQNAAKYLVLNPGMLFSIQSGDNVGAV